MGEVWLGGIIAIVGAIIGAGIGVVGIRWQEKRTRKRLIKALLNEVQHDKELIQKDLKKQKAPWPLKAFCGALHTESYSAAKEQGVLSTLPYDAREDVLDVADRIFALLESPLDPANLLTAQRNALEELDVKLGSLSDKLQAHLRNK